MAGEGGRGDESTPEVTEGRSNRPRNGSRRTRAFRNSPIAAGNDEAPKHCVRAIPSWNLAPERALTVWTGTAIVGRCLVTGQYVGYVPALPGTHTRVDTLDELHANSAVRRSSQAFASATTPLAASHAHAGRQDSAASALVRSWSSSWSSA